MVGTSLVAVVQNGLSQLRGVTSRAHFTVAIIRGLGGNLTLPSREAFAKQVIINTHYVCMFTFPNPVTHVCAYSHVPYGSATSIHKGERETESMS